MGDAEATERGYPRSGVRYRCSAPRERNTALWKGVVFFAGPQDEAGFSDNGMG